MNKTKIPMTSAVLIVLVGGGFVLAGYNVTGMTIMGFGCVILLFQNIRRRSVGPIGFGVLALMIAGLLTPAFLTATRVKDVNELAIETSAAPNVCPVYYGMNFIQKFNSGMSWCRSYPQYDPSQADKAPAVETGDATGSTTPNKLWK